MAHLFPHLAGLATIDPGLTVLENPIRLLFSIDMILVPLLFLALYAIIILIYNISRHQPIAGDLFRRSASVISGVFFLVVCTAIGGLISYVLVDKLPGRIQHSIAIVGIDADIHFPNIGYTSNSLHGNILSMVGFIVGLVLFISKVTRDPQTRRATPLTREQKMSPYQRMQQEKRRPVTPSHIPDNHASYLPDNHSPYLPDKHSPYLPDNHSPYLPDPTPTPPPIRHSHCRNQPLASLEPEAVNYRPLS